MSTNAYLLFELSSIDPAVLVSGWSENGWLSGGHAVRMALELGMHKAWPKLLKRMKAGKSAASNEERELVIATRTWFCLYLFEHQLVLRCALFLNADFLSGCPLALADLQFFAKMTVYRLPLLAATSAVDRGRHTLGVHG